MLLHRSDWCLRVKRVNLGIRRNICGIVYHNRFRSSDFVPLLSFTRVSAPGYREGERGESEIMSRSNVSRSFSKRAFYGDDSNRLETGVAESRKILTISSWLSIARRLFSPQPCLRVLQANVLYFSPRFLDDDDRSIDRSTQCLMIHPDNSSNSWKYSKELNIFFFFLLKKDSPIPRSIDTVCLTIYLSGRWFFEFVQVFKGIGRI